MENLKTESGENGDILPQPCSKDSVRDFSDGPSLRGFNFNGFNMLDLSHHLENDTVMSTSSSTSGGLVIDHDDGEGVENNVPKAELASSPCHKVPQVSSNGHVDVFPTPLPRRRSSAWSADKTLVVGNTRDCSQYLGMQPSVKFKCYKCAESNFPTLRHLKEHQQVCLTKGTTAAMEGNNGPNGRRINGEYTKPPHTEDPNTKIRISRKVFLCSACGTYYENWNLFLHMREVHRKHICLLCLGMFPSAERLHHHLESRHSIASADLGGTGDIMGQINSQLFYLMCVTCEHIFTEHDQFVNHNCDTYLQPCGLCSVRGAHRANCRARVSETTKAKRNGQTSSNDVLVAAPHSAAAAPVPVPIVKQKEEKVHTTQQQPPAPEPLDPVGEMWRRYLNGDFDGEQSQTPEPQEEVKPPEEEPPQRLLVPKLKVKIPKEFQAKLNSPSSSSEVESEEEEIIRSHETLPEIPPQEVKDEAVEEEEEEECVKKEDADDEEVQQQAQGEEVKQQENEEIKTNFPEIPSNVVDENIKTEPKVETKNEEEDEEEEEEDEDGIQIARKDAQMFDLRLNQPLDRIDMVELLRICLKQTIPFCLYCNHATRIVVNAKHLAMHLIATHRFTATVDSITAEELQPETIVARVKKALDELDGIYINLDTFDSREEMALKSPCDRSFNCFQCRLTAKVHKELYQHNRKMHMKTVILCLMCKSALYSYSELLYHMCPGYMSTTATLELKFRCGFCSLHNIPSAFRLMVHLRKKHGICEICLEDCGDQFKLSNHVWKHKLQHLCFRCGIVYRNKPDITKHLFWKHGTESVTCKKCLQKKWPLVYHFCIPPAQFTCEHCPQIFTRAVSLTVHRRFHTGDFKYPCTEENCEKKFISKRILEKHTLKHSQFIADEPVFFEEKKPTPCELKDPVPMDVEEKPDGEVEKVVRSEKRGKKSKSKRDDAKKMDLMDIDLPAPNLSESDSDMDIDRDDSSKDDAVQQEVAAISPTIAPHAETAAAAAEAGADDDAAAAKTVAMDVEVADVVADVVVEEEKSAQPDVDIWANFKSYQTLQQQASKIDSGSDDDEALAEASVPILHVSQSDHDYCSIYRVPGKADPKKENDTKADVANTTRNTDAKSGDSSDSSSGSDSTCTCESNCSCSSSSSSGSTSSSSTSSDEEQQRKQQSPERKKKHMRKREKGGGKEVTKEEPKQSTDVIDVVTVDKLHEGDENFEVLFESDLATDESDTDEDFYDEHPQKVAREMMMAWNRKFDDESRDDGTLAGDEEDTTSDKPSAPPPPAAAAPVPQQVPAKKSQKVKRKKKEKRHQKLPPLKLSLIAANNTQSVVQQMTPKVLPKIKSPASAPILTAALTSSTPLVSSAVGQQHISRPLSAGLSNGEDSQGLKRSKRRRIPNKFYGYSSDEDGPSGSNPGTPHLPAVLKPIPPPNLVWRKEDLPQNSGGGTKMRSPNFQSLLMAKKPSPSSDFATYNVQPPAQLPPQIFASTSPGGAKETTTHSSSSSSVGVVQPLRIPLIPPVVPVNRSYSDMAEVQANADAAPASGSGEDDEDDEDSASSDASHLEIRDTAPTMGPRPPPPTLRISLTNQTATLGEARPTQKPTDNVYCYCRCPYDEVSEMIACDGDNCAIEWFHFECVGIMVPPVGKWYCPECKLKQQQDTPGGFY